jgi:hypothetical protein
MTHPASSPIGGGVKRPESGVDHTVPYSTGINNALSFKSIPDVCLHSMDVRQKGNFIKSICVSVADVETEISVSDLEPRFSEKRITQFRKVRVGFSVEAGNFSLHPRVQNGSGAHPASYPVGTTGSFPRGKAAGA